MRQTKLPPYLFTISGKKVCSACGKVFPKSSRQSLGRAFAEHVRTEHKRDLPQKK